MQTVLKEDPSAYLHHKNVWDRHEMDVAMLKMMMKQNASSLTASASSVAADTPSTMFVTYGIEFSKQFVFFFSNTLSFLVAISFSQALTTTLKYYLGEQKLVEIPWLPWIIALLMLFICVIIFALLSLWIKTIIGSAPIIDEISGEEVD